MVRSRTIKTWIALLITMTLGTFALVSMESAPIRPEVTHLAAIAPPADESVPVVSATAVPIQRLRWRNIVIHTASEGVRPSGQCHFIVHDSALPDGRYIQAGDLWINQKQGRHISDLNGDLNANSIGVFVAGDFSRHGLKSDQFDALMNLVMSLQRTCGINADRVYLASDLDSQASPPAKMFPVKRFNANLIRMQLGG